MNTLTFGWNNFLHRGTLIYTLYWKRKNINPALELRENHLKPFLSTDLSKSIKSISAAINCVSLDYWVRERIIIVFSLNNRNVCSDVTLLFSYFLMLLFVSDTLSIKSDLALLFSFFCFSLIPLLLFLYPISSFFPQRKHIFISNYVFHISILKWEFQFKNFSSWNIFS